ncbi:MAG: chorismate synthase [bacterium]
MARMDYQTAGESHGPTLLALVSGMPAGVPVDVAFIDAELRRRQGGYGRGGRQRIEADAVTVLSGVRLGQTTGAPVALQVPNKDSRLDDLARTPAVHTPRPGHADLAGSMKYLTTDCRETLERASARETAARVAAGALVRCLLRELGIEVFAFTRSVHQARTDVSITEANWQQMRAARDASDTYCPDAAASKKQEEAIHQAKVDKTTAGGTIEAHVFGLPPGIGSTMHWFEKLDARLAYAVMGIQAIKGVEIGLGFESAGRFGHEVHDPITFDRARLETPGLGFVRPSNNAGGTEGGMSNGAPVVVRAAMKPIATLLRGMPSVDLNTKQDAPSAYERSDVSAVAAAGVVLENVVAFEVGRCLREKFGGDSLHEVRGQMEWYLAEARKLPRG